MGTRPDGACGGAFGFYLSIGARRTARRQAPAWPTQVATLAFKASGRAAINGPFEMLERLDANGTDAPDLRPEDGPTYYAVQFEDQDGLKLGIDHSLTAHSRIVAQK